MKLMQPYRPVGVEGIFHRISSWITSEGQCLKINYSTIIHQNRKFSKGEEKNAFKSESHQGRIAHACVRG